MVTDPVTPGRQAVSRLEVAHEVTGVLEPNHGHDLLDVQGGGFQQFLGPLHSERLKIPRGRAAGLSLEEAAKVLGRDVNSLRHLAQRESPLYVCLHESDDLLDAVVHSSPLDSTALAGLLVHTSAAAGHRLQRRRAKPPGATLTG
jgi:hypothetical protein